MAEDEEARDEAGESDEDAVKQTESDVAGEAPPSEKKTAKKAAKRPPSEKGEPAKRPVKRGDDSAAPARKRPAAKKIVDADEPVEEVVATKGNVAVVTFAQERSARRTLALGVSLAVLGLALVGTGPSEAGMAITLAGLLALIYGIHTFGRLGPEPAK